MPSGYFGQTPGSDIATPLAALACPSDRLPSPPTVYYPNFIPVYIGVTSYMGNVGSGSGLGADGVFIYGDGTTGPVSLLGVTDGTSNTILFGERYNYDSLWPAYTKRYSFFLPTLVDSPPYRQFARPSPACAAQAVAVHVVMAVEKVIDSPRDAEEKERIIQTNLFRCVMGNPFRSRPSVASSCLSWNEGIITKLAQAAYEERLLPAGTLENGRLAVLADALEEVGCTDADILGHLRGPGPHVRGCWPVDLCLGKS
jgi:hypothetical protein